MPKKSSPTPVGRIRDLLGYQMTDNEIEEILHIMDNVIDDSSPENWVYMERPPSDESVRKAIEKGTITSYTTSLDDVGRWKFTIEFSIGKEEL